MPSYGFGEYLIVLTGMAILSCVAIAMVRREVHRRWPGFFLYVVFHIFQPILDIIGVIQKWNPVTYYYFFYAVESLSLALSFVVIYEVFSSVMEPYDALRKVGKSLFFWTAAGLLLVGVLFAVFGPSTGGARVFKIVFYSERALRIVQVGLLALLFAISRSLALSWRSNAFGIALGYGIYASIQLVIVVLRLKYINFGHYVISWISTLSFMLASLIWLRYVLQPQRVAQPVRVIPYNDIAKWNEKLEELLKRKAA
jgi:hypothetical protein